MSALGERTTRLVELAQRAGSIIIRLPGMQFRARAWDRKQIELTVTPDGTWVLRAIEV